MNYQHMAIKHPQATTKDPPNIHLMEESKQIYDITQIFHTYTP